MTVDEAVEFSEHPRVYRRLRCCRMWGWATLLWGSRLLPYQGEAQQVKLATELSKRSTGKTLYILDEPTTGCIREDIKHLLGF